MPVLAAVLLLAVRVSADAQAPAAAPDPSVIVVDAGSTGTRVYKVKFTENGSDCAFVSSKQLKKGDALATTSPGTLKALLDKALAGEIQPHDLEIRVVGTGGFRGLDGGSSASCGSACAAKRDEIQKNVAADYPGARLHVASGEEEGKLDWISVAAQKGLAGHAIVDVGGSTTELAFLQSGTLTGFMAAVGTGVIYDKVKECVPPADFDRCEAAIVAYAQGAAGGAALLAASPGAQDVLGLGGGFSHLAELLDKCASYNVPNLNPHAELTAIRKMGRALCLKSEAELPGACRGGGVKSEHAAILCGQLAWEAALIDRFHVSATLDAGPEVGSAFADFAEYPKPRQPRCRNYAR